MRERKKGLTEAEQRLVPFLTLPCKEIAERVHVAESTVKAHLRNMFKKYDVGTRYDLLKKIEDEKVGSIYLTAQQVSHILQLEITITRTMLGRSEFYSFTVEQGRRVKYMLTEAFVQKLYNFLIVKNFAVNAMNLKTFWGLNNPFKPINTDVRDTVLKTATNKLKMIAKICNELADSYAVAEFQERIKAILHGV